MVGEETPELEGLQGAHPHPFLVPRDTAVRPRVLPPIPQLLVWILLRMLCQGGCGPPFRAKAGLASQAGLIVLIAP